MKKIVTFLTLIFSVLLTIGQTVEYTFNNPSDSATDHYITYIPIGEPNGLLLLLPSFGEFPYFTTLETSIPKIATENGLLTVIATLQDGPMTFCIDSISQIHLDNLIAELFKKYKLEGKKFYMGGFSIGGSGVIKYAERAYTSTTLKKPDAIFGIDPPLDFERFYNSMIRDIKLSAGKEPNQESVYFTKLIIDKFGGTPQDKQNVYQRISPYSFSDTTQQSVKKIMNLPIRLITEPDIEWRLKERNDDFYDINAIDCSAMINELTQLGNKNAILVATTNKGFRQTTKKRNPHSWSIADPTITIKWLLQF